MDFMGTHLLTETWKNSIGGKAPPSFENPQNNPDEIVMFSWKNGKKRIYKIYPIKEAKKKDSRFFEDPTG